jgi:glutamate racemase
MIGVFDSGIGGLTIFRALVERFPNVAFVYLGDHANMPYGDRASDDVVALTRKGVDALFRHGCRLALLGCNTATCIAARTLQQGWLPVSGWPGRNVLGIVAPTVEAATQTPWAVTTPQYPQKYNTDTIAVFGTTRTIASHAYPEEIRKRCPKVAVVQQTCPDLAAAIERGAPEDVLDALVARAVGAVLEQTGGAPPHRAILGCTHYRWSRPCSSATCRPSRGCCRSRRWSPTVWRTICNAIRAMPTAPPPRPAPCPPCC